MISYVVHFCIFQTFEDRDIAKKNTMKERCFLTTRNIPYFYLSPLKFEVVMEHPFQIYIYHDVVTNKEINTVKSRANLQVILLCIIFMHT